MSIEIDNTNLVEVSSPSMEIEGKTSNVAISEGTVDLDITVNRKEYSIVGDEVYIPKLYEDAPQWLKDLVNVVVDIGVEANNENLMSELQDLINQLAGMTVPLNTFTQSILALNTEDSRLNAVVETLNSNLSDGLNSSNAQIVEIKQTYISKDEARATVADVITAELDNGVLSNVATVGHVSDAIATETEARAADLTSLQSSLFDAVEGEEIARATAVQYLNTYVGIDSDGVSNGTGLLAELNVLQKQTDGIIETVTGTYDVMLGDSENTFDLVETAEPYASWIAAESTVVGEEELIRASHVGDVYIKYSESGGVKTYLAAYKFIKTIVDNTTPYGTDTEGYTWAIVTDTDTQNAYMVALQAYDLADGKRTTFYGTVAGTVGRDVDDLLVASNEGNKLYRWNGSSWLAVQDAAIVATAEAVTALDTAINDPVSGTIAEAENRVTQSLEAKIDNGDASIESKWEYGSIVNINGVYKKSGFGLTTNYASGSGTEANPYNSEFWVDASRLKFTNSNQTGQVAPFLIDATGTQPKVTFNGLVTFGSGQTGTIDEAIASTVETISVGDKNINITDNLTPTTSLVADTDNSGYQFIGDPVKGNVAGIATFAEPQVVLDGDDEVYSPYVDEVNLAYYFRFGIKGDSDLSSFKVVTIDASDNITYNDVNVNLDSGIVLNSEDWYIVDGIINPYGGNTDDSGSVRSVDGTKLGTVNNIAMSNDAVKMLLGWQTSCTISRMKLAKITADTLTGSYATTDYVSGELNGLGSMAYEDVVELAKLGTTVIDGGYIATDLVRASSILADTAYVNQLNSLNISAGSVRASTFKVLTDAGYETRIGYSSAVSVSASSNSILWDFGIYSYLNISDSYTYKAVSSTVKNLSAWVTSPTWNSSFPAGYSYSAGFVVPSNAVSTLTVSIFSGGSIIHTGDFSISSTLKSTYCTVSGFAFIVARNSSTFLAIYSKNDLGDITGVVNTTGSLSIRITASGATSTFPFILSMSHYNT